MGNYLAVEYAAVTSTALFRGMRQEGVVRVVAGHAGLARIMLLWNNLGKPGRPGEIVAVAERTISPSPGGIRFIFIRRLNMLGSRAMAHFTGHPLVVRLLFELIHIIMAVKASLITGISNSLGSNFLNRFGPIVSQLPKRSWHKEPACQDESYNSYQEEYG